MTWDLIREVEEMVGNPTFSTVNTTLGRNGGTYVRKEIVLPPSLARLGNDLHKAAGGERRHEPLNWRNTDQFKQLVTELRNTGIPVVSVPGRNGGTYVCKELVYAYAMS